MREEVDNKFPKLGAATVILVVLMIAYAVKIMFEETGNTEVRAVELCRQIVPALHYEPAAVKVLSVDVQNRGETVQINYRLEARGRLGRSRWVICSFDLSNGFYGIAELKGIETDDGKVGDGRLFVIKRWWLDDQSLMDGAEDAHRGMIQMPGRSLSVA